MNLGTFVAPDRARLELFGVPLPDESLAIYLSGSFASGWAHASSDLDVFVVTEDRFEPDEPTGEGSTSITPSDYPIVIRRLDGVRCDVEYWSQLQVRRLIERFATGNDTLGFTVDDVDFLYRLSIAVPIEGDEWLVEHKQLLASSEFRSMVSQRNFGAADSLFEDALGMLETEDPHSALLAVHEGFGRTVDGLLAHYGEYSPRNKWRARKMTAVQPAEITFAEYLAIETFADLDDRQIESWVLSTVERAREVMMDVAI